MAWQAELLRLDALAAWLREAEVCMLFTIHWACRGSRLAMRDYCQFLVAAVMSYFSACGKLELQMCSYFCPGLLKPINLMWLTSAR